MVGILVVDIICPLALAMISKGININDYVFELFTNLILGLNVNTLVD